MCFKRSRRRALAALIAGVLSATLGCGVRIGEKPAQSPEVGFGGAGYSCVGEIPEHILAYVHDELNDTQINGFMQCLEQAFTQFARLTRGESRVNYKPEELRKFIQDVFLKDQKVSDKLLTEFMMIKQSMVGGGTDRISHAELYSAVAVLEDIRKEAIRLRPHMQILNPNLATKQDVGTLAPRLTAAQEALRQTIRVFATRLAQNQSPYTFTHFRDFVHEFRVFIKWDAQCDEPEAVSKDPSCKDFHTATEWANFLRAFNEVVVSSQNPEVIQSKDWFPLLDSLSRWYMAFLHYQVGVSGQPILLGVGLQNLIYLADEAFAMTEQAVVRQPSKTITFPQLQRLLKAIYPMRWLPENLRLTSLQQAMQILVTRVFGDSAIAPSERRSQGLTLQELADMRSEFYRWAYVQLNLDTTYPRGDNGRVPPIQSLNTVPLDARKQLLELAGSNPDDFLQVREFMRPLYASTGSNRVMIVPERDFDSYQVKHGFADLSRLNLLRSIVALIFRGYVEADRARGLWSCGISDEEWAQFFQDFRELTIDVGLVDSRTTNTGPRTFVEGNLFTYQADGIHPGAPGLGNELSAVEAMELFGFLYSGGDISQSLRVNLGQICKRGKLDIAKHHIIDRACVADHLGDVLTAQVTNMPYLQKYLNSLKPSDRNAYAHILLATAYSPEFSDPFWVESSEFSTMSVLAQYGEAVMTRYDANGDGILDNGELEVAIPLFTGYIKELAGEMLRMNDMSDADARAALIFILDNKYIPTSATDKLRLLYMEHFGEPRLALDRLQLARVFMTIGHNLVNMGSSGVAPGKEICDEIAFGRGCSPVNPMRAIPPHPFQFSQ